MRTIRELREAAGLTQLEVAFRLGVTPQTVSFWERGTREPRGRHLQQLAALFGVTASDILLPEPEGEQQSEGKEAA